jgi:hypothetical protein
LARAALLFVSLLAPVQGMAAVPTSVALDYTATTGCPVVHDFKTVVADRLGYDPFRADAARRVLVQIAPQGAGFEGRIEWHDPEGKWAGDRTLPSRSADCRELSRAMAFALALQIQLLAGADTAAAAKAPLPAVTPPAPATSAPPPPPTPPRPVARVEPAATPPREAAPPKERGPGPTLAIGAGAHLGVGVSSSVVPVGRLFGSLAGPHWSIELAAEAGWPTRERRADGAGFSQYELLAGLAGCGHLARWGGCLVAKGGALRVAGQDIDAPAAAWGPLVEAGLRLAVTQPLGHVVFVTARAEGLLIVTRWRVYLDQAAVWTSSRFTETLGLDVGVRFP